MSMNDKRALAMIIDYQVLKYPCIINYRLCLNTWLYYNLNHAYFINMNQKTDKHFL
jgi:hypothetical protein